MAGNEAKRSGVERTGIAPNHGYRVSYFARKHGITREQAHDLIKRIGNNRALLNAAAVKLK